MITCREFDEFLGDYLGNELPWSTQLAVRWHFLICGKCRSYLHEYQRAIELGRASFDDPDSEVPDSVPKELVNAVLANIKRQQ